MGHVRLLSTLASAATVLTGCVFQSQPWLRGESAHVVVYSDEGEEALRAEVAKLEGFYGFLRWATNGGVTPDGLPPPRLDVYVVHDFGELRETGHHDDDQYARYYAGPFDTFAMALGQKHNLVDELPQLYGLLRSYAHHFRAFAPTWVAEGWAGYYGEAEVEANNDRATINDLGPRYSTLYQQSWIPITTLLGHGTVAESDVGLFHAQCWLLLRYLRSQPELRKQLATYIRTVGSGGDPT